ncbi:hypothetical protein H6G41_07390 [Tolypothrix sp. FACHB-123]|uniref:hypothetical protein n=1 Tax=Tolypothrix sp. FACHB-123 TaxID=2692868 RepID=UPI00168502D4|nr:hypothetical protein [Tolypothrix sp. FACHB-123]MBD2354451.1 hypothetical protein [Tolypothrix sp. FACHB-123]
MPNTSLRDATRSLLPVGYDFAQYKCPMPNAQCPIPHTFIFSASKIWQIYCWNYGTEKGMMTVTV